MIKKIRFPKDIYEAVLVDEEGLKLPALRVRLSDMVKSGIIANGQQGQYALVAASPKSKRNLIELTELTELIELIELTPHEDAACKADYKECKVYAAAEPYTPALHSNGLNPERISSISSISSSAPNAVAAAIAAPRRICGPHRGEPGSFASAVRERSGV